jgi:hypothetical protein
MAGAHEHAEHAEHVEHIGAKNKGIALLISVIALCLAFSETLGKSSQTSALNHQIEASNLWNFFQAKNIRRTMTIVASELGKVDLATTTDETRKAAVAKQVDEWTKTAARYRSEPDVREGTVELAQRAKEEEHKRDTMLAKYHHFEVASAGFQIAIVLASASVITGMMILTWLAGGLGVLGILFTGIGLFAPHAVHLF